MTIESLMHDYPLSKRQATDLVALVNDVADTYTQQRAKEHIRSNVKMQLDAGKPFKYVMQVLRATRND